MRLQFWACYRLLYAAETVSNVDERNTPMRSWICLIKLCSKIALSYCQDQPYYITKWLTIFTSGFLLCNSFPLVNSDGIFTDCYWNWNLRSVFVLSTPATSELPTMHPSSTCITLLFTWSLSYVQLPRILLLAVHNGFQCCTHRGKSGDQLQPSSSSSRKSSPLTRCMLSRSMNTSHLTWATIKTSAVSLSSATRPMLLSTPFVLAFGVNALHHATTYHRVSLAMSSSILISSVERRLAVKSISWQGKNMQSCGLWKSLEILWLVRHRDIKYLFFSFLELVVMW